MLNNRNLIISLVCLAMTTAATIVFLVLFIVAEGQVGGLKKRASTLQSELSHSRNSQAFENERAPGVPERHDFISLLDGNKDFCAILPPSSMQGQKDLTLVVYLHGMGSTFMEPFLQPKEKPIVQALTQHNTSLVVASLNYRGQSSWANDLGVADINQNIHELLTRYPISKIVIIGTSMGGCSALAYSYLAAEDIRAKIVGVVAAEAAGDLSLLYQKTRSDMVRNGMIGAFGGEPEARSEMYASRSLLSNMDKIPQNMRYALISAKKDNVIPPEFQENIEESLKDKQINCKIIEIDEKHGVPPAESFVKGLDYVVMGNSLN